MLLCVCIVTLFFALPYLSVCVGSGAASQYCPVYHQQPFLWELNKARASSKVVTEPYPPKKLTMSASSSQLWLDYVEAQQTGRRAVLPDFSHAGYRYSEAPIPHIVGPIFNVLDYGAQTGQYCDETIQKAIAAAEAAGGGVVYFPPGVYHMSPDSNPDHLLFIRTSNIVLRGAGAEPPGESVILIESMKPVNGVHQVTVTPSIPRGKSLAKVTKAVAHGDYSVEVDSSKKMSIGQEVYIHHQSTSLAKSHYDPMPLSNRYKRLHENGFLVTEHHRVVAIEGNRVVFGEPIQIDIPLCGDAPITLKESGLISEVGIEDIRFVGRWDAHPEAFVHHKDAIHDYGWEALRVDRVRNGWIRRCVFEDLNTGLTLDSCCGFTVENCRFVGKRGHSALVVRRGYGVLVKDCIDTAGHHHGPNVGYQGVNTVYLRHRSIAGQQIDSHSGSPYCTLLDFTTEGGVLSGSGGPIDSLPHHGRHLVLWNYHHRSRDSCCCNVHYDFWTGHKVTGRPEAEFCLPILVGLHGDTVSVDTSSCMAVESLGAPVWPPSLFEAQLALRLGHMCPAENASCQLDAIAGRLTGLTLSPPTAPCGVNLLKDPSFEEMKDAGRKKTGWEDYKKGFYTSNVGRGVTGPGAIKVEGTDQPRPSSGAMQKVNLAQTTPKTITFSGWAKVDKLPAGFQSPCSPSFYLQVTLHLADGTTQEASTFFDIRNKGWQQAGGKVTPRSPVESATFLCAYEDLPGVVRFDDMALMQD
eukprot:comp17838_c0_seq1/m.17986 comp17838_c0_seq1/g.17986  ORF comp17838_c0_seq1/g.17986 comp17838_c0_seq1/m.17986 type:complete len:748 (-) comp17838_c0_seq1:87-2330(-)